MNIFKHFFKLKQGLTLVIEKLGFYIQDQIGPRGKFHVEHWRDGVMLSQTEFANGVTTGGKNYLLGVAFQSVTQLTAFAIGLIDNASFSALSAADTMASHAGWLESVAYSQSTRVAWGPGAPSGAAITNGTAASFTMNATAAINGIFVNSDNTKSGTSGTLWSTGSFASVVNVVSADVLKITYSVSC